MAAPAASVDFELAQTLLNFKLYAFVDDLKKGGDTSMELRLAILDAFSEAGIAMSSRQAEVAPRNMERCALKRSPIIPAPTMEGPERQGARDPATSRRAHCNIVPAAPGCACPEGRRNDLISPNRRLSGGLGGHGLIPFEREGEPKDGAPRFIRHGP
jgi:hypothetical protein